MSWMTPQEFDELVGRSLLMRVEVCSVKEGLDYRLACITRLQDTDTNVFLAGYEFSYREPTHSYDDCVGLRNLSLHVKRDGGVDRRDFYDLVDGWLDRCQAWANPELFVAVHGNTHIAPSAISLLQLYARFQTALAYEIRLSSLEPMRDTTGGKAIGGAGSPWTMCGLYYRLAGFIKDRNRQWSQTIGTNVV